MLQRMVLRWNGKTTAYPSQTAFHNVYSGEYRALLCCIEINKSNVTSLRICRSFSCILVKVTTFQEGAHVLCWELSCFSGIIE